GQTGTSTESRLSQLSPARDEIFRTAAPSDCEDLPDHSRSMNGESKKPCFLDGSLIAPRPVKISAIRRNIAVVGWLAAISAIICPLLAASPNILGSKGIEAIGGAPMALAN